MKHKNITTISTNGMSREDWLAQREFGIGGSDVGSVFLLDRFKPAIKLFHQKIGLWNTDESDNLPAFFGRNMEDFIYHTCWKFWDPDTHDPADMISNNEANTVIRKAKRRNAIIINDDYPWLRANIDYEMNKWRDKGNGILELKTGNSKYWGQYEAGLPTTYIFQIQMYMLVTGYEYGEIFGLIDGRAPQIFPVEASPAIHERILEETGDFWKRVEMAKEIMNDSSLTRSDKLKHIAPLEPDTEDTEAYEMYMKERYKTLDATKTQQANIELEEMRINIRDAHVSMNENKAEKLKYTNELRNYMIKEELNEITLEDGKRITWFNNRLLVPAYQDEKEKKV